MAKKRISRDLKRKSKLAQRAKKERKPSALAITGNKYKTDALAEVYLATETGIHQAFVLSERTLTDDDVEGALESLVLQLRAGELSPTEPPGQMTASLDDLEALVIMNIRANWAHLFAQEPHPGQESLIGVLRTLLGSVNNWRTPSKRSQGYLRFVEGFLRGAGSEITVLGDEDDVADDDPQEQLLELGRLWCLDGDRDAEHDFRTAAKEMIRAGEATLVGDICRQLLGEAADNPAAVVELSVLAHRASAQAERPR